MIFRRRAAVVRRGQCLADLEVEGARIVYLLKRSSARRSLSLRVNAEGMAQVNAPWSMAQTRIDAFLRQHATWLRGQLARRRVGPVWQDGVLLPFLGGEIQLEWRPVLHGKSVALDGGRLVCEVAEGGLEAAVIHWYRSQAAACLADRMAHVCARLERSVPVWRLSNAYTRWGSLSAKGVVSLNWRLVKGSVEEIDYVICHELAHFRRRDHSAAFWQEVAALYPDYQTMRQRLRRQGTRYLEF